MFFSTHWQLVLLEKSTNSHVICHRTASLHISIGCHVTVLCAVADLEI